MNIKNEASFVVCKYFSNIFTLWGFFLIATYWLSFYPPIDKFRTMLWANQFQWIFLAPFFVYVGFEVYRKFKTRHKGVSVKVAIIGIVMGAGIGILYVDYAFFESGILMIIPQQHPETKKDPVEYDKLEKTLQFGEFFALPLVNVAHLRVRKKLEDDGDIQLGKEIGTKTKIICICGAILIALAWVIYYNDVNHFWSLSFN